MSFAMAANDNSADDVDTRVRRRVRELRRRQGLTLAEVARRAALGVSMLSRLESGKRRLPLDHLPGLAAALGVRTEELLNAPIAAKPWVAGRPQVRDGLIATPLTRSSSWKIKAYRVVLDPGARREPPDPLPSHTGQVSIHVLAGRLRLLLGPDEYEVAHGQTVEYSCATPHWFGVVEEPVEAIFLTGSSGPSEAAGPCTAHGVAPSTCTSPTR